MKKWLMVLSASLILVVSGCSVLDEAQNTLTYVNEATGYVNKATEFANEVPALAQDAVNNLGSAEELEAKLLEMKDEIVAFSEVNAPQLATDIHQGILEQNEKISTGIDVYLNELKDGLLNPAVLENNELFQSVQEITGILDQIKQLGE